MALTSLAAACGSDDTAADSADSGPSTAGPPRDAGGETDAGPSMDAALRDAALADAMDAALRDAALADANVPEPDAAMKGLEDPPLPEHCANASTPPATLDCIGLYTDVSTKAVSVHAREFAPAVALWSDGADKQRWVKLPQGTVIDGSNPNEWAFPIGTKFFKEFSRNGRRVETRMWHKVDNNFWVNAAYAWDEGETQADRSAGGDITLPDGSSYHIPTFEECEECHRGRTERILGFGSVLLGLAGATGVTLEDLADEGLLVPAPARTSLTIGDDGSGVAPEALGWLHANCGITCHNGNSRAIGYPTGMFLRLDPADLDGRTPDAFDSYDTTVGVAVTTSNWLGNTRIVPGYPEQSLLYRLITTRGRGMQMPPFASDVVDTVNTALVGEWIRSMPPAEHDEDAGLPDEDAGVP
jgi:hypothetical protein